MWQFVLAIEGLKDACEHFQIPIVSGNVSFITRQTASIYPRRCSAWSGLIEKAEQAMTHGFAMMKMPLFSLVRRGMTWAAVSTSRSCSIGNRGSPPFLNLETEKALQDFVLTVIQ